MSTRKVTPGVAPGPCNRCGGRLEEGFVLDHLRHVSGSPGEWIAGPPEATLLGRVKYRDRRRLILQAWRCVKCGSVELFAP